MRLRWTSPATTTNQRWNQIALRSDGPKGLRFLRPRGNQDSINLFGGSKIKFIIQFHADKKGSPFPIRKSDQSAKLMTSKVRRHVKPGSAIFASIREVVSIIATAFSKTPCEFAAKTTTGFLSGWIFDCRNGTR
jgi:hypothetical protein